MKMSLHKLFGITAISLIVMFFTFTVVVEIIGNPGYIALIKQLIVYALFLLTPVMGLAVRTGKARLGTNPGKLADRKQRRMKLIGIIGLTVLVPCAITLNYLAQSGSFGAVFYTVQAIELFAGGTNIFLMGRMIRDGLTLARRRHTIGPADESNTDYRVVQPQ